MGVLCSFDIMERHLEQPTQSFQMLNTSKTRFKAYNTTFEILPIIHKQQKTR